MPPQSASLVPPHGGHNTVSFTTFLPLALVLAALVADCLAAAQWGPRRIRPLWLALACGIDFGVNAFLLRLTSVPCLSAPARVTVRGTSGRNALAWQRSRTIWACIGQAAPSPI
jgi:hypothetical protein